MKVKLIKLILVPTVICFIISYLLDKKFLSSTPIYLTPIFFGINTRFF